MNTTRQFFYFTGLGAIGTAGHYATLIVLVQLWDVDPVIATTFGFIVGAVINYMLNYHITFQSDKRHVEALSKFLLVATIGAGINAFIMFVGVDGLKIHYLLAQIIATGIVLAWNFLVNKFWTFTD